jgi:hypothetical protein
MAMLAAAALLGGGVDLFAAYSGRPGFPPCFRQPVLSVLNSTHMLAYAEGRFNAFCSGGADGSKEQECSTCQGRGARIMMRQIGPGMMQQVQVPCSACKGQGKFFADGKRCRTCDGAKTAKEKKVRKMFNILIVVDDFADEPAFSRRDALLHSLYTRGRHAFISTICATQKFRALSNIIRVNATALIIFRLRSEAELQAIVEEISAVYGKDTLIALIRAATEKPYSFLYCDLAAKRPDEMFWLNFEQRLVPDSDGGESDG